MGSIPKSIYIARHTGHQTVNHTYHFKDPVTGVHINTIESYWNRYDVIIMYATVYENRNPVISSCFVLCLYKQMQAQ